MTLDNPAEIVIYTKKDNDDKKYVGNVLLYGYDTSEIGNMVTGLAKKKNVVEIKVNHNE